jgi:transposase
MILPKTKEIVDYLKLRKKLWVLQYAKDIGSNKKAYEFYEVKKTTFYKWKKAYDKYGEKGLLRQNL